MARSGGRASRRWRWAAGLLATATVLAPVGWLGSDVLERDNDFCNACHLSEGLPLHIDIRRDFDRRPVESLAGAHGVAAIAERDAGFRCIDCHGGVGLVGRSRVKALAAADAFWWAVGHFDEPSEMGTPLLDADCRQCHASFAAAAEDGLTVAFHGFSVHNVNLGMSCVTCHLVHEKGGDRRANYLHPASVRRQCAVCHSEFDSPL